MSKLFIYCMLVIGVYVVVIYPLNHSSESSENEDTETTTNSTEKTEEKETKTGASGRLSYSIGYTR